MKWMPVWWPVVGCQSGHHQEKAIPAREDITIAWLADSFRALIEKSMSICASSSPGRLPARLKSPNEAWSRYLIPDSLSQSDFAAEVIHPSGTSRVSSTWTMQHVVVVVVSVCILLLFSVSRHSLTCSSAGLSDHMQSWWKLLLRLTDEIYFFFTHCSCINIKNI